MDSTPELSAADRLNPYAAAIRYGLGNPGTVDAEDALRWATLAIEWAEAQTVEPGESDDDGAS